MDFRQLLGHLEDMTSSSGKQEFDSREVSIYIVMQFITRDYRKDLRIGLANNVKRISNDLNRLYRMQLLKRKRIKRNCKIKRSSNDGKTCDKGFMFRYSFTRQGLRYIRYLRTNKMTPLEVSIRQSSDLEKDPKFLVSRVITQETFPPQLALVAWKYVFFLNNLYNRKVELKGRYRRFPPKIDAVLLTLTARIAHQSKSKDEMFHKSDKMIDEVSEILDKQDLEFVKLLNQLQDVSERYFKEVNSIISNTYGKNPGKSQISKSSSLISSEKSDD
jgi:hypothetical protein